jgi:hypothetical protein
LEHGPAPNALRWSWDLVDDELRALEHSQNADGSWGTGGDVATTGLVLLAFLGCGETHNSGAYKDAVKIGLRYLSDAQDDAGRFAPGSEANAVAALAMIETYGLTGSRLFVEPAQRAVDHIAVSGDSDHASETVWTAMVLKSARMAELRVDNDVLARTAERLRAARATQPAATSSTFPELTGAALEAGLLYGRVLTGEKPRESRAMRRAADDMLAAARLRAAMDVEARQIDLWFETATLFQFGNDVWVPWREVLRPEMERRYRKSSASDGSLFDSPRERALRALTFRATQGYRSVFPDDDG